MRNTAPQEHTNKHLYVGIWTEGRVRYWYRLSTLVPYSNGTYWLQRDCMLGGICGANRFRTKIRVYVVLQVHYSAPLNGGSGRGGMGAA
jgi:hypothetical protein